MTHARAIGARLFCSLAGCVIGVGCFAVTPAAAQPQAGDQQAGELTNEERLRDFIHFVRIARYDAAGALGEALIGSGVNELEFVDLVEKSGELDRFERAVAEAMRVPELEDTAAAMDRLFRRGKLARARRPDEIARNIELLTGGLRARALGRERLISAGEYALPQLVEAYLQGSDPGLKAQVQHVLIDLGRQSIVPLCTALEGVDPVRQEAVAEILGLIPYRTSLPYLTAVHQKTDSPAVREETGKAIARLGGDANADVAGLFSMLAEAYYDERSELTSFAGEEHQLLWHYDPGLGLRMTAIRTPVFHEAMSMRTAERSLRLDASDRETIGLWLAANFSREIDSPEGYANPAYGADRRPARYFAIAAGADTAQYVVDRALEDLDTPLAIRSIRAVQSTAGPRTLWGDAALGRRPMLEALSYPNRRVQYEAALALGVAQPESAFPGSERVVPLLAGAVRDAGARYAAVLTGRDRETYDRVRRVLEGLGYQVLPPAETGLAEIAPAIAETPGIDLVVTSMAMDRTIGAIEQVRSDSRLSASPVLAMLPATEIEQVRRRFVRDRTVSVRRSGVSDAAIGTAAEELVEVASGGPIGQDEAGEFADRALAVLRDLAVSRNSVLNVEDAAAALVDVLDDRSGDVALDIAEVLAHIGQSRAQDALMDRAQSTADAGERVAMLGKVADSGKRFGNLLEDRMVRRLVRLAGDADDTLATRAAATMGALGISNDDLVPLMLGDDGAQAAAVLGGR